MTRTRPRGIFLSGEPGSGKTTTVYKAVDILKESCRLAGFLAPELRSSKGFRIGFNLRDLEGREWCLARRGYYSPARVGNYGVCVDEVNKAVETLRDEIFNSDVDIVIIDEIGPMELKVLSLRNLIIDVLLSDKPVIGVVHRRLKTSDLEVYRLVERKGDILYMTRQKRDLVASRFLGKVEEIRNEYCSY
ncbi:MAG: nucleoside-triphosphatase [Desulfurococcales archaeon]|nr:nucleoside-triphosphatase [Desulfurococcales archaeon]